jgi:hypothetical protein
MRSAGQGRVLHTAGCSYTDCSLLLSGRRLGTQSLLARLTSSPYRSPADRLHWQFVVACSATGRSLESPFLRLSTGLFGGEVLGGRLHGLYVHPARAGRCPADGGMLLLLAVHGELIAMDYSVAVHGELIAMDYFFAQRAARQTVACCCLSEGRSLA